VSVTVNSATSVTATSPAESAGTVDITVTTAGGTSATSPADKFVFEATPTVSVVAPSVGATSGGTTVTITGTNFVTGATAVAFGANAATSVTVNSASSITATAPPGSAGTVDITVTTPGGTSATGVADDFTYDPVPTVTAVSPSAGPTTGGTAVTITGSGFVHGSTVAFGTGHPASATYNSPTQLTATAPAGSSGSVDITVTTPGGTSATSSADQFTYDPAPNVTGVSPNAGPVSGGTSVTITGTNFGLGSTAVSFGTQQAATVSVTSSSQIVAVAPAGVAGTVDITVTDLGGTSTTSSTDKFTYAPAPTVSSISPSAGPLAGGTAVTVTGAGFVAGSTSVSFGPGAPAASVTVTSSTQLTATAPAGIAGAVGLTVTTPNGTSPATATDQYSYDPVPTVTAIGPAVGPAVGGTTVTVTGSGFVTGMTVNFGAGHPASSVSVISSTSLTASSPAGSTGAVDVTVVTPGGGSATSAADRFSYVTIPTVSAVSVNAGPTGGGTVVTVTGTNFVPGATSVWFGANAATGVTVNSTTSVTATSPPGGQGSIDITVATPGGTSVTSGGDRFTYDPPPAVTGLGTSGGTLNGGTAVTISGTGFVTGATSVSFGAGHPAESVTVNSTTSVTATSPAEPEGTVDIIVTTPNGTSTAVTADRFTYDPIPTVTAITPAAGPTAGGVMVTVVGTGFVTGKTAVSFGSGHAATSINVLSPTTLQASPPAGSTGGVDVTVTTPGGTSFTSAADRFTYSAPPTVTSISPKSGPSTGGTSVSITGTNFIAGATTVMFGTKAVAGVTVSTTSITATSPPVSNSGTVDVTVITAGGMSSTTPADTFTYTPVPVVTGLSPAATLPHGGTLVTIHGVNLGGATAVAFGSVPATSFKAVADDEVTAVAPPGKVGALSVTVTTALGTSGTSRASTFHYATAPVATGQAARAKSGTEALLRGLVRAGGLALTSCQFQYGRSVHYAASVDCSLASTASGVAVSAALSGLAPATTYHYRLLARTAVGAGTSADGHFTTPQLPVVHQVQVGLLLQAGASRRATIGELLGVGRVDGAAAGETITVICLHACKPRLIARIPVVRGAALRQGVEFQRPVVLSAATAIQINVAAPGLLTRYLQYGFSLTNTTLTALLTTSGCIGSGGQVVACRGPT
jgi:hypothetical protein